MYVSKNLDIVVAIRISRIIVLYYCIVLYSIVL